MVTFWEFLENRFLLSELYPQYELSLASGMMGRLQLFFLALNKLIPYRKILFRLTSDF